MREQILMGELPMPSPYVFQNALSPEDFEVFNRMWLSLWHHFVKNKSTTSTVYWYKQFSCPKQFNIVIMSLSEAQWIISHSIPARNWAEIELNEDKLLQFVSPTELDNVRAMVKIEQYLPIKRKSTVSNVTKLNNKYRKTGLVRNGFKASGNTEFSFDVGMLAQYKEPIVRNVNKGMEKVRKLYPHMQSDKASYDAIATVIVDILINNPRTYTMGNNISDSRGRAIKEALSKVANPIGYKDFRALVTIPEEFRNLATDEGAKAVYLFIAELHGFKQGSILDKELFGVECYHARKLHTLDLENEDDRSELFENIWLERLYKELDAFNSDMEHYWSTPIELDASALT